MMRPRLFYEKSRIHDVSWGLILFEGWDMLRQCEAILAWHMRREILYFSGQYLAMAQIRHSEPKQELWTKMNENERKQEKEIQRDAMRLCLWILYISFHCGVRRCHCGVSRATFLEMVSVAHDLALFCMVWFYNVLYGSYVFAAVLSYASSLLIRYAVEAGPATTWVSLAARVWTRNIGLQFCKMKRARIALG